MAKLKTYNEFVNEGIADVIKSPVKYVKIKNNLKKYQKAKVAQALNDVDFAKRKAKGKGDLTKAQSEVLTQANKAKNAALADTTSAITQRMKDLATSPILQKVVTVGTTKSRMAANKIALKSATGEEAKQLKIKATELSKKANKATGELKDYESTAAKKAEKPAVQEMPEDKPKTTTKPETTTETKPKTKLSAAEEKKAEQKQKLGDQIGKAMQAIEKAKQERVLAQTEEDKLSKKLSDAKGTDAETALARSVADADKAGKDIEKAIKDLQKNVKDLQQQQKDLNESINEGMYTASQLTNMLLDDIRKGIRGIHVPDEKELKTLALKRLKMKRVMKRDIEDTINGWENSLADARKDKIREYMFSDVKATKGKIPESFDYVAESVSEKFARLRPNL